MQILRKGITAILGLILMLILAVPSFAASTEGEVIAQSGGNNIWFSNGYIGFCADYHIRYADKNDVFTAVASTDSITNNTTNVNVSQKLKILVTQYFEEFYAPDGTGSYSFIGSSNSDLQSIIWHYTDDRYTWGKQKTIIAGVDAYNGEEIKDSGYTLTTSYGDRVVFHFMVMQPYKEGTQEYFAYTFTVNAPDPEPEPLETFTISYDLDGGSLPNGQTNPTSYNVETETFTLVNPTRTGYTFVGWMGSNGNTPEITVTIPQGSIGDKSFTAKWEAKDVIYKVEHWQEMADSEVISYTKVITETLYAKADSKVMPAVRSFDGFHSPAAQEVTVAADGTTVVKYYYNRYRYEVTINRGTGIDGASGAGIYRFGETVIIDATVEDGYEWNGWVVVAGGIIPPEDKEASFTMPANAVILTANGKVVATAENNTWTEWKVVEESLVKFVYSVTADGMVLEITPDDSNPAISYEGDPEMRSGYGFSAQLTTGWKNAEGYDEADDTMVTGFQTVSGHFPEFRTYTDMYAVGRNKVRWMEDIEDNGIFVLPVNTEDADGEDERLHFTPVWFPNADYIMWTQAYDCWTPAGMMSSYSLSNPIKIVGSIYEDWFIGRGGAS